MAEDLLEPQGASGQNLFFIVFLIFIVLVLGKDRSSGLSLRHDSDGPDSEAHAAVSGEEGDAGSSEGFSSVIGTVLGQRRSL